MTTQEQVTIIERWGPSGIRRWAKCQDGKFVELPFQRWLTEKPDFTVVDLPRETNYIEPDAEETKNEYAVVHIPDRSRG